jgi:hypothetical protein
MRKESIVVLIALISLSLAVVPSVLAPPGGGGIIIITPQWPIQQNTPATLTIYTNPAANPTYSPSILLVMTVACHTGLTEVKVEWSGGGPIILGPGDFTLLTGSDKIPDSSISNKQYERASLADHLYVSGESVYYAMRDFPIGTLTTTPKSFTVTLASSNPRMLVYALGKSTNPEPIKFDRWVPPTNPGLVVPEPATILLAVASFGALATYGIARKRTLRQK